MEPEGRVRQLEPASDQASELAFLQGEEVEVEGQGGGGKVKVKTWKLLEGTHGLQAFVGIIRDSPRGLGIEDRTTQAFYTVDQASIPVIVDLMGKPVILEGYVEGARALHVVYYRPLVALEPSP